MVDQKTADEKKPAGEKEAAAKPSTQKLKKGPFRIEVSLDGIFEAQNQAELFIRPQEWAAFSVLKAVEHGAVVKQGDLVLALDTEKIDRVIADLRAEVELNELALKQATAQLAAMEKIGSPGRSGEQPESPHHRGRLEAVPGSGEAADGQSRPNST